VISRVTPGLLKVAVSAHFEFPWAKALICIATAKTGMRVSFIDFSLSGYLRSCYATFALPIKWTSSERVPKVTDKIKNLI
jgi:hypothetical protein